MKKYKVPYQDLSIKDDAKRKRYINVLEKMMRSGKFSDGARDSNFRKKNFKNV